ncbi:HAD-IIB family hydrolase [candidate division KSB1 bacterium]|nr:HAD-IIB family hydrolase [candidate division KSB1 bacterium]
MLTHDKLYVQLYNIHGLFRGQNLELGRDADTGGQTKYVLELAEALSQCERIRKVEVVTRRIADKTVSGDYSTTTERVNDKFTIVRIRCGGNKYLRKEQLWDHLEEFVDRSIKYLKSEGELPDIIHSHYADAGFVCVELTQFLGVPFVHTGHSLGRNKLKNLLADGMQQEEIERKYKISRRIEAEGDIIYYADRIITSTQQEIEKQYGLYNTTRKEKFVVIPPSIDIDRFYPYNERREWDDETQPIRMHLREELWRFFTNMNKPIILTICRPETRKNIGGLVQAYGEDKELQKKANLAVFAGIRKDISQMPEIERNVLTDILLLMDKYNLYGKMAIPKKHDVELEIPELYRIAAETRGVFVNSAFNEPFGLTLIEAASSGLPIVATDDGGPRDIVGNLENGLLVNVENSKNISKAIHKILDDEKLWNLYSYNGMNRIKSFYSWSAHIEKYNQTLQELYSINKVNPKTFIRTGKKLFSFKKMIVLDIDDTITGDKTAMQELGEILRNVQGAVGFGVATGRSIESALKKIKEIDFPYPDVLISSVGSELYYHKGDGEYALSSGWERHISFQWKREQVKNVMDKFTELVYQAEENQRDYKISYDLDEEWDTDISRVHAALAKNKLRANAILSHNAYLDILPFRANKGKAIRYLAYRWNIPYTNICVAGDSGNDQDMLTGELLGIVVANHDFALNSLRGRRRIYFSSKKYARGVIDGLYYYNFLEGQI